MASDSTLEVSLDSPSPTAGPHKEILALAPVESQRSASLSLELPLAPDKLLYFWHMELLHPQNSLTGPTLYLIEAVCKRTLEEN